MTFLLISQGGIIGLFIVAVVVIGFLAYLGHLAEKKRREELRTWAASLGLSFSEARDSGMDDRFPEFDCLREGSRRYAYNIARGTWNGRGLLAFDYHYETYSTDSKGNRTTTHHHFSAAIIEPDFPLKPLFIRPEGFFDKVKASFGFDDIDFESAEFSKKFFVKADDRKWAYDVIHARTMEYLLASPKLAIEFDTTSIIVYEHGTHRRWTPQEFEKHAGVVHGVLDRLPDYVVQQQRTR